MEGVVGEGKTSHYVVLTVSSSPNTVMGILSGGPYSTAHNQIELVSGSGAVALRFQ